MGTRLVGRVMSFILQRSACGRSKRHCSSSLSFDGQLHIHRSLFLRERTAQFGKRNILQLPNALPRDTKFFTHFLKRLRFPAVETEALEDNLLLAIVENV